MLIAIISDTHDNLATLAKFLGYIAKNPVRTIIHCGDVAEGQTLDYLAKNFSHKIYLCEGNMDYGYQLEISAKKYPKQVNYFKEFGSANIGGLAIGFCHHKEIALSQCQGGKKYDFVFYGHTHKPWHENFNNRCLANPGNLAGMFYKASFAILDVENKKLDLKILDRMEA